MIRAGLVVPDTDLHLIGPGQLTVIGDGAEDLQAAIELDAVSFLQCDSLHILYVLAVDTVGVTVQRVKRCKDLSPLLFICRKRDPKSSGRCQSADHGMPRSNRGQPAGKRRLEGSQHQTGRNAAGSGKILRGE